MFLLHRLTHTSDGVLTTVAHLDEADYVWDDPLRRPEPLADEPGEIARRVDIAWGGTQLRVDSELPHGYGLMTWRAKLLSQGRAVESSGLQTAWGTWTPSSETKAEGLEVELIDGFGDLVLTRQVAC